MKASTVPSAIDVSADGAYLFFYRDGLELLVVRLRTGEQQLIGTVPRTMSSTPDGRFSPFDPRRLAVAMSPKSHQVTLLRIRERR